MILEKNNLPYRCDVIQFDNFVTTVEGYKL